LPSLSAIGEYLLCVQWLVVGDPQRLLLHAYRSIPLLN
jgi:hypothetical protein